MCATGLRHAPTARRELSQISRWASRTQTRAQHTETVANAPERVRVGRFLHAELELVGAARLGDEPLLGAFQRQPLVVRSEEHTSELQSQSNLVCRLLLEKKKKKNYNIIH